MIGNTVAAQTTKALANVQIAVGAAGGSLADIAKWTILVTDPADMSSSFLVEIEAVAAIPTTGSSVEGG